MAGEKEYPFNEFFKWYLQIEDVFEGKTTEKERDERKQELWQILEGVFSDLKDIMPYENLRDEKERIKFRLCTAQNLVVGITSDKLAEKCQELRDIGFTFDTLIIDERVSIVDILSAVKIHEKL